MVNRRVQEKVVFISKKDLLHEFHWQTKICENLIFIVDVLHGSVVA